MKIYSLSVTPNPQLLVLRTCVCYSSHWARKNEKVKFANKAKNPQSAPLKNEWYNNTWKNIVLIASQPWSNNCPSGDDDPVLLAYFPSQASNVQYIKQQKADHTPISSGKRAVIEVSHMIVNKTAEPVKTSADRVKTFGATYLKTGLKKTELRFLLLKGRMKQRSSTMAALHCREKYMCLICTCNS